MKNNDNDKLIDENKDEEKDKKDTRRTLRLWNSPNPAV